VQKKKNCVFVYLVLYYNWFICAFLTSYKQKTFVFKEMDIAL